MKLQLVFAICLVIGSLHSEKIRYDNYKLFKLIPRNADAVEVLHDLELSGTPDFSFWNSVGVVGMPVEVMVAPDKVNKLESLAASLEVDIQLVIENVQERIDLEQPGQITERSFGWTQYNTLDEINDWLRNLEYTYTPNVTLVEGGRSYEGRIIYGVKVSYSPDNVNNTVFLESNIHANEWITSAVSTYILNELLTSSNETVRQVAESHDWYLFPVFNPDGFNYAHTVDRLWRKTRVPHSVLCIGADPNRNWGYYWNNGGVSSSNSPCSEIYNGPEPFSEPSCRSLSEFISEVAHQLVGYISFHSFMQLLLLPYGHVPDHLNNYEQMYQIGLKSVEALARRYDTHYYVGNTYLTIYPASGTSADWVKGTYDVPIVYTYELRDRGEYGFLLPANQILPTAEETLDSFITIFIEYEKSLNGNL